MHAAPRKNSACSFLNQHLTKETRSVYVLMQRTAKLRELALGHARKRWELLRLWICARQGLNCVTQNGYTVRVRIVGVGSWRFSLSRVFSDFSKKNASNVDVRAQLRVWRRERRPECALVRKAKLILASACLSRCKPLLSSSAAGRSDRPPRARRPRHVRCLARSNAKFSPN